MPGTGRFEGKVAVVTGAASGIGAATATLLARDGARVWLADIDVDAALAALHTQLLTPDLVKLFTEEFAREVERLTRTREDADAEARQRLKALEQEIDNLAQHFLAGAVSPTLAKMLADREAEKARLTGQLDMRPPTRKVVIPHPALVRRYEDKVARLREALNDEIVREDAIASIRDLIDSVTVQSGTSGRTELEVEATTARLIDFAETANAPRPGDRGRSGILVAGTGFDRRGTPSSIAVVAGALFDRCRTRFALGAALVPAGRWPARA